MTTLPMITSPVRLRVYLLFLQTMFILLFGYHLVPPISRVQAGLGASLAILTLLVVTLPRARLEHPWFISLVTLGNTVVLFATFGVSAEVWLFGTMVLLVAMASYAPSILQFSLLSVLLTGGYGLGLYQAGLLGTDEVLVLPLLLSLTVVFVSKITTAQAEIQRMVTMDEHPRHRAGCDPLTGLPNRAQFLERATRIVQYAEHNRSFRFAIMFVDLDGFKPINDRLGHKAGDAVLRHVSKVFQSCLRAGDVVGRYGGDEFTLLLNQVHDVSEVTQVAERILTRLQAPIDVGERVTVGASIGITFNTNMSETAEKLILDADQAMYRAKAQGKNRYVVSNQAADVPTTELPGPWKWITPLNCQPSRSRAAK
jgi:diguanylate cyclase (GGDEF)-like protein